MIFKTVSEDNLQHWTESAKYCYKIGGNCGRCNIYSVCETLHPDKCRMKSVVLGLVKRYGVPDSIKAKNILL